MIVGIELAHAADHSVIDSFGGRILMIFTWVSTVWTRLLGGKIATWP